MKIEYQQKPTDQEIEQLFKSNPNKSIVLVFNKYSEYSYDWSIKIQ